MLPRPLDTLLAYKAISLTAGLSGTEKRVAAAVVDSFNRKTGQCDPSFDRIAHLLGISRRSVIRAVGRVEQERLFSKVRHGGKFYRNSYQPNWVRFREIEAQWGARIKTQHWKTDVPNLSPSGCQSCHHAGDEVGTQTNTNNHSKETTSSSTSSEPSPVDRKLTAEEGYSSRRADQGNIQRASTRQSSMGGVQSRDAALGAAERRWNSELSQQFATKPTLYAELIDLIDLDLQSAATEHEMKRRGGGLAHILQQLELKNIRALRSDIHAGTAPTTTTLRWQHLRQRRPVRPPPRRPPSRRWPTKDHLRASKRRTLENKTCRQSHRCFARLAGTPAPNKRPEAHDPFYGTPAWKRTRAAVIERDRYRCTAPDCGTPNRGSGGRLIVDHAVERRKGGTDHPSNLRTLCPSCDNRRHGRRGGGY